MNQLYDLGPESVPALSCGECIPVSDELFHPLSLVCLCKLALCVGVRQRGQKSPHLSHETEAQGG